MAAITVHDGSRQTAIRAAWLFDGGPDLVADPLILLDGGSIVSVRSGAPAAPEGVDVVDYPGGYVLSGLVDTHVHLAFDSSLNPVGALAARDEEATLAAMIVAARKALWGGVTTVRDLGDRDYLSLALRGRTDLPTILSAGPPLTCAQGHCHYLGGAVGPGERGVREAVRAHAERRVDVIKIMASGGTLTPGTRQEESQFTRAELAAAVDEAHRHGLPITAHAHATQAVADALAAGVDGIEHASFWSVDGVDAPEDLMQQISDQGVVVGATMGMTPPPPGLAPPPAVVARMPRIIANAQWMVELGVRMVAGTDAGIGPVKPPDALRYAAADLQRVGMTPVESLRTMTSIAATVLGLGHVKGKVAPGYDADLLILDANPLADPQALHAIRGVYRAGVKIR
ncbi:MAG: amidohydrolase family protein [Kineosporiaceae bacterium]